ncbi:uncharacterized protein LOC119840493 [Zerene cesonia]|uniref:uncharacterized protein LOC119840493 n=1 Tax=Zerene cesonia TaxID=33412 RepID=UPI0018E52F2B|nr:uncharacterized protein LOC119840493 [Zerene cesonia]XP_038223060.1 uncharacterized protein LOC119840493 [Zerene cesonia]
MANHAIVILGCFLLSILLQVRADAAEIHETLQEEISPKLDSKPNVADELQKNSKDSNFAQREKRFYNYFDYNFGFNFNSQIPSYTKRDQSYQAGNYGVEDQLDLIFKKLQEITSTANRRSYLPPPPQIPRPAFIPFLYVPKMECQCPNNNEQSTTSPPLSKNPVSQNTKNDTDSTPKTETMPKFPTRLPEIDEMRDTEDNDYDYGDDSDGARPISLKKPVKPSQSSSRPSPPLEHGSNQAGLESASETQSADALPQAFSPDNDSVTSSESISVCESASIFCCHQPQVSYECFTAQSCVNPVELVEPCDPQSLLRTIKKLQHLYNLKKIVAGS